VPDTTQATEDNGIEVLVTSDSVRRICSAPSREQQQLVESLERYYAAELKRILPTWTCYPDGPAQPPVDVAKTVGVPPAVLGAILAGKCRDQRIPATVDRQKRYVEWMQSNCAADWFSLHDSGVGPECAKGIVLALALNDRFTGLDLACNSLGDGGAEAIARVLPEHKTLAHMDLAANNIGHAGAAALLDALLANRSVTYLDLSARPGRMRNRLARQNAGSLEGLLRGNAVLARLNLMGTALGPEGTGGIARGLGANTTLRSLDLASNDIGPRGAIALAEALGSCALEELNLSENRIGDEGLVAIATKLGSVPPNSDTPAGLAVWSAGGRRGSIEGVKISVKYQEALAELKHVMTDLSPSALGIQDAASRQATFARATESAQQLAAAVELACVEVPRLKAVQLSNNGGSLASFWRVEDLLQANHFLEKLSLDQSDHRGNENGLKSIIVALPINSSLRSLSLGQCRLGSAGVIDIAKALAFNQTLECLCIRGNQFGEEAATALSAVLATGAKSLKQLNLGSCHLDDPSGAVIAAGLAANSSLEVLNLRDNCLGEASGRGLNSALRGHPALLQLPLELNGIDLRWLGHIKKMLDRNIRLREKARPQKYRKRIDELVECQREVNMLTETIKRNGQLKKEMRVRHGALMEELEEARVVELAHVKELETKTNVVEEERRKIEEELGAVLGKLRQVAGEGEYEASQLNLRIHNVEDRVRHVEKQMAASRKQLEQFEAQAGEELTGLREELEKAEKARSSAELLAAASQRNLDSFASSVKAIREDVAGGDNPRQRTVEVPRPAEAGRPGSRGSGRNRSLNRMTSRPVPPQHPEATPRRPVTPVRIGKASPRTPRR